MKRKRRVWYSLQRKDETHWYHGKKKGWKKEAEGRCSSTVIFRYLSKAIKHIENNRDAHFILIKFFIKHGKKYTIIYDIKSENS